MTVVSYGGGVNSTAMLIWMHRNNIPVDLILFADPSAEQPHTYEYLPIMDDWLSRHGMPTIQKVFCTDKSGQRLTLEQECLRSGTLPALAYGHKKCSLKHKVGPQDKFCNNYQPCRDVWARGEKVVKYIRTAKSPGWTGGGAVQPGQKAGLKMFSGASSGRNARNRYHRRTRSYDHSRSKLRGREHDARLWYSLPRDTAQGKRLCNTRFHAHIRNRPHHHVRDGRQWNIRQPYRR